jgi:hypothetical protein
MQGEIAQAMFDKESDCRSVDKGIQPRFNQVLDDFFKVNV